MSDKIVVGQAPESLRTAPRFAPISKIELVVSDELAYYAGDDSGRMISIPCPWGTQQIANDLLQQLKGYQYQPFYADQVPVDPAVEIGDALSIGGVYGGFYGMDLDFRGLFSPDVEAPEDEEINHEFEFKTQEQRQYIRDILGLSTRITTQAGLIQTEVEARTRLEGVVNVNTSTLVQQAGMISAKVEKSGGDPKSFYWALTDSDWEVGSNGSAVFQVIEGKAIVHGDIYADGGQIAGLKIGPDSLTWNGQDLTGAKIDLGKGGGLKGDTDAGRVLHGVDSDGTNHGTFSGSGLTERSVGGSRIGLNTVTTSNVSKGITDSLAYANTVYNVLFGTTKCTNLYANGSVSGNTMTARTNFSFKGHACSWVQVNGTWVIGR